MKSRTKRELHRAMRAHERHIRSREELIGGRWETMWRLAHAIAAAMDETPNDSPRYAYLHAVRQGICAANLASGSAQEQEQKALAELTDLLS